MALIIDKECKLIIVGKTGSGKSSLGNSLLGHTRPAEQIFEAKMRATSVTENSRLRGGLLKDGTLLSIVDTPGLFDTSVTEEQTKKEISKTVALCAPGPHAILFVLRIGRFTKEEFESVDTLIKMFGKKSINYFIIVFTGKDQLDGSNLLHEFVKDSPKYLTDFVRECNSRYVGIANDPSSPTHDSDVKDVMELIYKTMEQNGNRNYTQEEFAEAERVKQEEIERRKQELKAEEIRQRNKRLEKDEIARNKRLEMEERERNKRLEMEERERNARAEQKERERGRKQKLEEEELKKKRQELEREERERNERFEREMTERQERIRKEDEERRKRTEQEEKERKRKQKFEEEENQPRMQKEEMENKRRLEDILVNIMKETELDKEIGVGLAGFGVAFLFLGVVFLFDKGLLAIGNLLFISGLAFVIGLERTFRFFFQIHKLKGTGFFFGGILMVLLGWPVVGMRMEVYGFLLLFSGFFPVAINFLRRVPIIGTILYLPGIRSILFISGLAFVIGLKRTLRFFFQRNKLKATGFFFGGILMVLLGWPVVGMCLEVCGFLLLFSGFFPVAINFLRRVPIIGTILYLPGIRSLADRLVECTSMVYRNI